MRYNPDISYRALERLYHREPTFNNGINLLKAYLRLGLSGEIAGLYSHLSEQYPAPYTDLAAEDVLLDAHFLLGRSSKELCHPTRTIICRFSKPLVWDKMRGYPSGTTQSWIDAININLYNKAMVDEPITWWDDERTPSDRYARDRFHTIRTAHYATALFHGIRDDVDDAFFRVIWNNIHLAKIQDDVNVTHRYSRFTLSNPRFELMLEDEPILRDYNGPRISLGSIPSQASGGRNSSSTTFTMRVELEMGISEAIDTCVRLANCIYFAQSYDEVHECSGIMTYRPT